MSKELLEFSEQIDERFDILDTDADDFWETVQHMFI